MISGPRPAHPAQREWSLDRSLESELLARPDVLGKSGPGPERAPGERGAMRPIEFSSFVNELATVSGQAILPFFRSSIAAEDKSRGGLFDPVTEADRASEASMRQLIKRTFPTHGIVGEEFGSEQEDA
jgi:hypothetical protein